MARKKSGFREYGKTKQDYVMRTDFNEPKHAYKPAGLKNNWKGMELRDYNRGSRKNFYNRPLKELKAIANKEAKEANRNIERLQKANISSPAYNKWLDEGGHRFSVKGKNYNQVQSELARIRQFNNAKTSTVKGANDVLKDMASNIGREHVSLSQLQSEASNFFRLADRIDEYLRTMDSLAMALGYQEIWQAINEYTEENRIDLSNIESNFDELTEAIAQKINYQHDVDIILDESDSGGYVYIT